MIPPVQFNGSRRRPRKTNDAYSFFTDTIITPKHAEEEGMKEKEVATKDYITPSLLPLPLSNF